MRVRKSVPPSVTPFALELDVELEPLLPVPLVPELPLVPVVPPGVVE